MPQFEQDWNPSIDKLDFILDEAKLPECWSLHAITLAKKLNFYCRMLKSAYRVKPYDLHNIEGNMSFQDFMQIFAKKVEAKVYHVR